VTDFAVPFLTSYVRAGRLLTDLAYHWPPRGMLMPRALRASGRETAIVEMKADA
jgi:hypothetical protein